MKNRTPSAVGLSSLLVIFAVLCLTVFSLLSLSSVRAYDRLAEKSRQATLDYYAADCCAEELLARLRAGDTDMTAQDGVYRYSCALSDTQILTVAVEVQGAHYKILQWQTQSITDWQPDEKLYVWTDDQSSGKENE